MNQPSISTPKAAQARWFSVILLDYYETEAFWDRDAGLLYNGLCALGIDARLVAIGDPAKFQREGLVLGSLAEMQTPQWWKQWDLQGVLLYSWGLPRFTPVIAAIKEAGIRVVLIMDTGGYISPRVSVKMFWRIKRAVEQQNGHAFAALRAALKCVAAWPLIKQRGLFEHLRHADVLAFPSTLGKQRYTEFLREAGHPDIARRAIVVPHPISSRMRYDASVLKERVIIAVGGWNRVVKNAPGLVAALGGALAECPEYSAHIVGPGKEHIEQLVADLPNSIRNRFRISGSTPPQELVSLYQRSRISVCSSFSESFHIATGEALCCGCSFVGDAQISSMPYFASIGGAGTLAPDLSVKSLSQALLAEIDLWETGMRDPLAISNTWTRLLHPDCVARQLVRDAQPHSPTISAPQIGTCAEA